MKRILIYDVAAENGGGYEILKKYYDYYTKNTADCCFLVTGIVTFEDTENLKNISFPWVKKSWFHRLYCDMVVIKKMIRDYQIDEVLSLQNIAVKTNVKQTVYVQNVIPYSDYRFSFWGEFRLWLQKNIIGFIAKKNLTIADKIIVQTNWMKDRIVSQLGIQEERITVEKVSITVPEIVEKHTNNVEKTVFFYPAAPFSYKNHMSIIRASKKLLENGFREYEVIFTFNGNENKLSKKILHLSMKNNLPIIFAGYLNKEQVWDYYTKSILLFPSKLETVGIPLLEAKAFGCDIIANDALYSRETLGEYDKCYFYCDNNSDGLYFSMKKAICNNVD